MCVIYKKETHQFVPNIVQTNVSQWLNEKQNRFCAIVWV